MICCKELLNCVKSGLSEKQAAFFITKLKLIMVRNEIYERIKLLMSPIRVLSAIIFFLRFLLLQVAFTKDIDGGLTNDRQKDKT